MNLFQQADRLKRIPPYLFKEIDRKKAEAIAGSTRMKGGLAQKMVLQMLSTSVMVRMGRVRGNLMIEVGTRSSKLRDRAIRILMELSGQERGPAGRALDEAQGSVSRALELLERSG